MEKLDKRLIISKLEENKITLKSFGIKKIELFGSYAKDEEKKDSDIDFIVEFENNRGLFDDYFDSLHFLEELFNKKIDLVKSNLVRDELKKNILEGIKYEARI